MIFALLLLNCAPCHQTQVDGHAATPMARTLQKPLAADLEFKAGAFTYKTSGARYSVTDGATQLSATLAWAVGFGTTGQTYLFERNGAWYESAVSYYPAIKALDWTPGHAERTRRNLDEALGRRLEAAEAQRCFGCHSTAGQPGVQCSQCHEGSQHPMAKLSRLGPEELSAVCSKCHPSWAEVAENGPRGIGNVRHQVYRLASSKCYDTDDRRIACTACHDPHSSAAKPAAFFDARCGACHTACRAGNKNGCVSCHMPKIEPPGLHSRFTDHRIRVARPGEKYPD
jgi:hypothetical protein